jgi:phthalate 3,4-dioxygenase ferredoxin reductase component
VVTRFGVGVHEVSEREDGLLVELADGAKLTADVAVVGIGAVPNVEWLADSGLVVDDGVTCDEYCRALGPTRVFAAGDVARWWHPRENRHRRVEHWTHAGEQGALVAHNIAHPDDLRVYDPVDYVWSDQYDWRIQMAGRCNVGASPDLLGRPSDGWFAALFRDATDRFVGAVTVNWQKAMIAARRLLLAGDASIDQARAIVEAAHQKRASA